jgi:hypothetical protein
MNLKIEEISFIVTLWNETKEESVNHLTVCKGEKTNYCYCCCCGLVFLVPASVKRSNFIFVCSFLLLCFEFQTFVSASSFVFHLLALPIILLVFLFSISVSHYTRTLFLMFKIPSPSYALHFYTFFSFYHPHPSSAEVMNMWNCTSTPLYICTLWCIVKAPRTTLLFYRWFLQTFLPIIMPVVITTTNLTGPWLHWEQSSVWRQSTLRY